MGNRLGQQLMDQRWCQLSLLRAEAAKSYTLVGLL